VAITGLTRLNVKQLLTSTIWNSLIDVLEAKFSSGVNQNDLTWPVLAKGDIDFQQQSYTIKGLRTFWKVINASEYATLDAAIAAAPSGGAVFIPPNTTISANNVSIASSNVTVFGAGPTSVIKITAAATGPLLTTATSGLSDIVLMNLMLDGTGAGAGAIGVSAKRITRFVMVNVVMKAFTGDFIVLTNGGVAGQSCADVYLSNIYCTGGSDNHLFVDDVSGLIINGFASKSATGDAISMVPPSSANLIQDILIANMRVQSGGAKGIRIIGSGAAGIDAHSRIKLSNCHVVSCTGLPYELGNTAALLKDVQAVNCFAPASLSDAMRVATNRGEVVSCHLPAATSDGIDITNSVDLWVHGNNCQDAGAYGINATSTTDCTVTGNNLRDTGGVNRTTSTNLRAVENVGDEGATVSNTFTDVASYIRTATGDFGFSHTIPGGTLRLGDALRITVNGVSGIGTVELRIGGLGFGTFVTDTTADSETVFTIRVGTDVGGTGGIARQTRDDDLARVSTTSQVIAWSTDKAITFQCTAYTSGSITLNRIFVELLGAK